MGNESNESNSRIEKIIEKVIQHKHKYKAMPSSERSKILPKRNVCSIYPADDMANSFFTGNGRQNVNIMGDPYNEMIVFNHEALYEPMWAKTPEPPDLTAIMPEVRRLLREGKFEESAELVEKAQLAAGFGPYFFTTSWGAVIPQSSLRLHQAYRLKIQSPEYKETYNYLRWLDMLTGVVTVAWENERGHFKRETIVSYKNDTTATRFTSSTSGKLDVEIEIIPPIGDEDYTAKQRRGLKYPGKCKQTLSINEDAASLEVAYFPEYGQKGYCSVMRFIHEGGSVEVAGNTVRFANADSIIVVAKTVKYEDNFQVGCSAKVLSELPESYDFDAHVRYNREYLGERMERSRIWLNNAANNVNNVNNVNNANNTNNTSNTSNTSNTNHDNYTLSGEELLKRTHMDKQLDSMLLEKLYDMGRFYQIVDTGDIPPMWGQHNINTNVQVCAGVNTGLFDEMDVYFRYYESKFEDFRINAKKLFGARGLLASVHCDYDSGLLYHFSKTYPHYCWTGCLGWIYNEFWGYYLATGDKDFLANRIIPALKEIALFYEDYACDRDADGKVIFYPSFSPENPTMFSYYLPDGAYAASINAVMDIMICREVLDNLIEGCRELAIEQDKIDHWEKQRSLLPNWLADEEGGLKEWAWPTIKENFNHRHVSHHYGLWPGRLVTWEDQPELAKAIQLSNRKRGGQDDSAHGFIHRLFSAIRLKDVEETVQNLSYMMTHGYVTRTLSTNHFPYFMHFPDLLGAMPAILLEMCVYSAPGIVEFLPAMPDDLPEGSIEGIWLYTWAKLERMTWSVSEIKVIMISDRDQELTLRYRGKASSFNVDDEVVIPDGNHIRYSFSKGREVEIRIMKPMG